MKKPTWKQVKNEIRFFTFTDKWPRGMKHGTIGSPDRVAAAFIFMGVAGFALAFIGFTIWFTTPDGFTTFVAFMVLVFLATLEPLHYIYDRDPKEDEDDARARAAAQKLGSGAENAEGYLGR